MSSIPSHGTKIPHTYWAHTFQRKILPDAMKIPCDVTKTWYGPKQIYIYNKLELKTLRLYRDILRITELFQYITIAFVLIRGLGFDIKKFNFKEDIADLNLSQDDEEEVELSLGTNEVIFRKIRKKIR